LRARRRPWNPPERPPQEWYPRPDSNRNTRFRKPCPLPSYERYHGLETRKTGKTWHFPGNFRQASAAVQDEDLNWQAEALPSPMIRSLEICERCPCLSNYPRQFSGLFRRVSVPQRRLGSGCWFSVRNHPFHHRPWFDQLQPNALSSLGSSLCLSLPSTPA